MPIFQPNILFHRITEIPVEFFVQKGIKLVILDVDNTLTTHGNPTPADGVVDWIRAVKTVGITLAILSNNTNERVKPFADELGLPFVAMACKPLTIGLTKACKLYKMHKSQVCLIGDQIFTDILGGNLKGVCTILVEPYEPEKGTMFAIKRMLEKPIVACFKRKKKA